MAATEYRGRHVVTASSNGLRLGAICLLSACMRIYPDPELPDLKVEWREDDCRAGTSDVTVTLDSMDSDLVFDGRAACRVGKLAFDDLPREQYELHGLLLDTNDGVFSRTYDLIDLRSGSSQRSSLYFGGGSNLRVAWVFDMGASCESLGADAMAIDLLPGGFTQRAFCGNNPYFGFAGGGTFSVRLRAEIGGLFGDTPVTVAASAETAPTSFGNGLVDLGTITVTPCEPDCPEAPPNSP
jgi:hypothetical protein